MTDTPKTWGEMTDAEKGALLLAWHERKVIEFYDGADGWTETWPEWFSEEAYRIRPEPERETVILYSCGGLAWSPVFSKRSAFRLAYDLIDGKPDPASIKLETLE